MVDYRLTKQAIKQLQKIKKSDINTARRIKSAIFLLKNGNIKGESLQWYYDFFKIRVGKFRIIHTTINNVLIITIIEKRETIYKTFKHLIKNSDFLNFTCILLFKKILLFKIRLENILMMIIWVGIRNLNEDPVILY